MQYNKFKYLCHDCHLEEHDKMRIKIRRYYMLSDYENEMLMNSRLSVMHSKWYPLILFAAFASIFYFAYGSFIFGILWLMLAWISVKRNQDIIKRL